MFFLGDAVVTSPSDLKLLSDCEFAFARMLDYRLKWLTEAEFKAFLVNIEKV